VRRHHRSFQLLAPFFALTLLLAACGGTDEEEGGPTPGGGSGESDESATGKQEGGTPATGEGLPEDTLIDYATLAAANPNHIDPATADTRNGSQVTELLYNGLTEVDSDNELVPDVAEEWESNEDATEWTFTLRDDVTFSDGEQVTPTTFKRSWERALNPELASSLAYHYLPIEGATEFSEGDAEEITGVVADDEANTLTVTLADPLSDWPAVVSHTVFSPVPEEAYSATTADEINEWERGVMIGNGPYAMDGEWENNVVIPLTENTEYWGEAPNIPNIDFRISSELEAAYNAFEGGEGDTAYIPAGNFADATETYNNATDPSFGLYYFAINYEDEFLGGEENLAVRQAISMAIDRERINEQAYDGARESATGVTPPGIPGFTEDLCGEFCTYDEEAAADLVEEWGKADEMDPIELQFNLGGDHEDVVNIVEENLTAIGLPVEQVPLDGETYFDEMQVEGGCSLCRAGWIWDYPSYYNGMYALFNSVGIDGDNLGRFNVPEFDEVANEAAATSDEDERNELWNEAEEILFDNMGVIVLNWYTNQVVYSDRVEGLVVNGLQAVNYPEMSLTEG
jgi:ABC-type transport system substrate-binding protein